MQEIKQTLAFIYDQDDALTGELYQAQEILEKIDSPILNEEMERKVVEKIIELGTE